MHDIVQDYYGRQLQHSDDLKTSACCDISQMPPWLKPFLARAEARSVLADIGMVAMDHIQVR